MIRRAVCLAALAFAFPGVAGASATQESTVQDDGLLVNGSATVQAHTLDTLKALGADRLAGVIEGIDQVQVVSVAGPT